MSNHQQHDELINKSKLKEEQVDKAALVADDDNVEDDSDRALADLHSPPSTPKYR